MSYQFFQNRECEYFPCHKGPGIDCNCIFCFCPLYFIDCGGNFKYAESGIKDCTLCVLPHTHSGYDKIISILKEHIENGKSER